MRSACAFIITTDISFFLKEDVLHPGTAAVDYLKQNNFKGTIYMIGSANLKKVITEAGFDLVEGVSIRR